MAVREDSPGFQFLMSKRIPPELILETIQHVPFEDGARIKCLRRLIPRVQQVISQYEYSLTRWFMKKELRHAAVDFPYGDDMFSLRWLSECVSRYDIVDAIMRELTWCQNCVAVASHNVAVVYAGLLLLYRLASLDGHAPKHALLKTLSRSSSTALYLALQHATLTARYHGHGWIHQRSTYGYGGRFMDDAHHHQQLSLRNELEFCFAEASLCLGPVFLYDMLVTPEEGQGEISLLNVYHEHASHDWDGPCWEGGAARVEPPRTQGPQKEDKGTSLFTALLERMAEVEKCSLAEVRRRVDETRGARDHDLAFLTLDAKARVIAGEDVVSGLE
ncbi:hypothetical protein ACEQ8H_006908 [Pleosporales sp. CAS-2024a]